MKCLLRPPSSTLTASFVYRVRTRPCPRRHPDPGPSTRCTCPPCSSSRPALSSRLLWGACLAVGSRPLSVPLAAPLAAPRGARPASRFRPASWSPAASGIRRELNAAPHAHHHPFQPPLIDATDVEETTHSTPPLLNDKLQAQTPSVPRSGTRCAESAWWQPDSRLPPCATSNVSLRHPFTRKHWNLASIMGTPSITSGRADLGAHVMSSIARPGDMQFSHAVAPR